MEFDYKALVSTVDFWTKLCFGVSDFNDQQMEELAASVEQICSKAISIHLTNRTLTNQGN